MIPATLIASRVTIFQAMEALGVYDGGEETTRQLLCPVHVDSRPSARVYADENRVHCYTCGRGWDVLGLVMTVRHVSYPQAGAWLMERFGLGAAAELPDQLRASFSMPVGTVAPLFAFAEKTLRASKRGLTCEQFSKLATALDVVQIQYRERGDREQAAKDVGRILKFLQGSVAPR